MKICFLAGASSVHTIRWINAMAARGHEVSLITMHPNVLNKVDQRITVYNLLIPAPIGYYANWLQVKSILSKLKPEILHAHYASGYGTLARKAGFRNTLLSVWGSDVYLFPYDSKRNENILRKNLAAANMITVTGKALEKQTRQFMDLDKPVGIVAFGIETDVFKPIAGNKENERFCIGTVKRLKKIYGIDILLKGVAALFDLLEKNNETNLMNLIDIMIVGGGPELANLQQLAIELGIDQQTKFVDEVAIDEVPLYLNQLDVYCAFSRSESFGVAVLEASSCEVPVIVSDVGGLPEVVKDSETGFIVSEGNTAIIAGYLYSLLKDSKKRIEMGKNGRTFVKEKYDWENNVSEMEKVYQAMLQ